MRNIMRFILLAFGIIIAGSWVAAQAQTGDCYLTLPGCLDSSFGVNGKATVPAGMSINDAAIQTVEGEPQIVVVGRIDVNWAVARYRPDGTLDSSFGSNGIVQKTFSKGGSTAYAVAVQSDGKLLVAGSIPSSPAITRYNPDGSLDLSFGSGGTVPLSGARAIALQSDGKIVVVGIYVASWLSVARLNPNGSFDTSFNGGGQYIYRDAARSDGYAVALQTIGSQEHIVIAGFVETPVGSANRKLAVFRFTSDGALDPSFGTGGVAALLNGADDTYSALAVDSINNRILAVGGRHDGRILMVGYDPYGTFDTNFGAGGIVSPMSRLASDGSNSLAIQPDGQVLVGGGSTDSFGTEYFAAWRFSADGSVDPSFGINGWVTTSFPWATGRSTGLALQSDGKFILAGRAGLARYFGYLPQQPAYDIAVYGITASPSSAFQGDTITAQVTVGNNGTESVTSTVTVTENPGGTNLGTQPVSLASGETVTLPFSWQTTTSTATGNHTLLATATITTPGVTDAQPANNSFSTTVTVVPFTLTARGYKVKNLQTVDLSWTGARTSSVDIYRNGSKIKTTSNTGKYTDNIGVKGSGTYNYKVCDASSTRCSNTATVVF